MTALLPPNSTRLERLAAEALASIGDVPVPLRDLADPDRCPVALLPYLAWARSVDRWESTWSEATKRQVIKSAYFVHAHKGTQGAIRRAIAPLGYRLELIEWHAKTPQGTPGTFDAVIDISASGFTDEGFAELQRLISDAKPVSRHLERLAIRLVATPVTYLAIASIAGESITLYPRVTS